MFAAYAASINPDDPLSGLELGERPDAEAPDGWVIVDVKAASLNHHDLWSLRGVGLGEDRLPMVLGCDAAGLDRRRQRGDRPRGDLRTRTGATTRPSTRKRSLLSDGIPARSPSGSPCRGATSCPSRPELSFEEAACLPTAWLTAYRMLFRRGGVTPGQTVLVQGAGGGVASAADRARHARPALRVWVDEPLGGQARQGGRARRRPGVRAAAPASPSASTSVMETRRRRRPGATRSVAQARRHVGRRRRDQRRRAAGRAHPGLLPPAPVVGSTMGTRDELQRLARFWSTATCGR